MAWKSRGSGILNTIINSLPFEAHLPGYRFCGPGTRLRERLERGDQPVNGLDAACRAHDIAYAQHKDTASRHAADKVLVEQAWKRVHAGDSTLGERIAARLVTTLMKGKLAVGAGMKKRRKRVLPTPARGGFLPFLPILAALGAAAGGAAQIASAVNKKRAAERQLSELQRHHRQMESTGKGMKKKKKRRNGKGLHLRMSKNGGRGLYLSPKKR